MLTEARKQQLSTQIIQVLQPNSKEWDVNAGTVFIESLRDEEKAYAMERVASLLKEAHRKFSPFG